MVLAEIGGSALGAVNPGWAIIIGERLRKGTGAVIVEVADLVGQRMQVNVVVVMMVPVMAVMVGSGLSQPRVKSQHSQDGARGKLQIGHLVPSDETSK
jgi:hypothetical protein